MKAVITDVRILEVSGSTVHIEIVTDVGSVQILTECERIERRLVLTDTHIEGLHPGALGRSGLNAIAGKLKEIVDVDTLEIHGAIRTTGANRGRRPKLIIT